MDFLKKQIGPLPLWGWSLVVIAGVVIGYFVVKNQKSNVNTVPTVDNTTPGTTSVQQGNAPYTGFQVNVPGQQGPPGPRGPRGPRGPIEDQHVCPPGYHWEPNVSDTNDSKTNKPTGILAAITNGGGSCVPDEDETKKAPGPIPTQSPSPPPVLVPRPVQPVTPPVRTYTVQSGDWLFKISNFIHVPEPSIYSMNRDAIEADARKHGYKSSNNGNLIFPGLVLRY